MDTTSAEQLIQSAPASEAQLTATTNHLESRGTTTNLYIWKADQPVKTSPLTAIQRSKRDQREIEGRSKGDQREIKGRSKGDQRKIKGGSKEDQRGIKGGSKGDRREIEGRSKGDRRTERRQKDEQMRANCGGDDVRGARH